MGLPKHLTQSAMSRTTRLYFTALVSIAIWSLLAWNYYHGGVPSHHVLAREDLPLISNWWGGFVLPLLTWFLLFRINKRIQKNKGEGELTELPLKVVYAFAAALLFGVTLAILFSLGYKEILGNMLIGIFILALFRPVYRAECLLGFVLGMTYTFGAVLPTAIGALLVVICLAMYHVLRPAFLFLRIFILRIFSKNVVEQ